MESIKNVSFRFFLIVIGILRAYALQGISADISVVRYACFGKVSKFLFLGPSLLDLNCEALLMREQLIYAISIAKEISTGGIYLRIEPVIVNFHTDTFVTSPPWTLQLATEQSSRVSLYCAAEIILISFFC